MVHGVQLGEVRLLASAREFAATVARCGDLSYSAGALNKLDSDSVVFGSSAIHECSALHVSFNAIQQHGHAVFLAHAAYYFWECVVFIGTCNCAIWETLRAASLSGTAALTPASPSLSATSTAKRTHRGTRKGSKPCYW